MLRTGVKDEATESTAQGTKRHTVTPVEAGDTRLPAPLRRCLNARRQRLACDIAGLLEVGNDLQVMIWSVFPCGGRLPGALSQVMWSSDLAPRRKIVLQTVGVPLLLW